MLAIRPATLEDAATVTAQRRAMFFDMGHRDEALLDSMTTAFIPHSPSVSSIYGAILTGTTRMAFNLPVNDERLTILMNRILTARER